MMPNMQPSPVKPGAMEGEPDKNAIKQQLVNLLRQAQKMAQANGIDFSEVLSELSTSESQSSRTLPHPPRSDMMGGGMPGGMGPG